MSEKKAIEIPKKLYEDLDKTSKNLGFSDVEEYVLFVLEELVQSENSEKRKLSDEEKKEIKEGLKKLGYE